MSSSATTPDAGLYIGLAVVLSAIIVIGAPLLLGNQPISSVSNSTSGKPVDIDGGTTVAGVSPSSPAGAAGSGIGDPPMVEESPHQEGVNSAVVGLLMRQENQKAIDLLEPLLQADLHDKAAAVNLAIAYNNLALKQSDDAQLAIDSLWRSYCLMPDSNETRSNLEKALRKGGTDPNDVSERLALGDKMARQGCLYGAYAEYCLASAMQPQGAEHEATIKKLDEIKAEAKKSSNHDINGALYVKVGANL